MEQEKKQRRPKTREAKRAKIQVVVRMRPLQEGERKAGHTISLLTLEDSLSEVAVKNEKLNITKRFKFDTVFNEGTSQGDIFRDLNLPQLIQHSLDGYNVSIFAYGQTGSGKTFTMDGYRYTTPYQQQIAYLNKSINQPLLSSENPP